MASVYEKYPLPKDEQKALFQASILSEVIIAVAAIVLALVLTGLSTGDWLGALGLGWVFDIAARLTPHWAMLVLPAIMLGLVVALDREGSKRSASYRASRLNLNQGLNGELPRLPYGQMLICMALAGICEELLFRYCVIGLLMLGLGLVLPEAAAAVVAVLVSTIIFWAAHAQYRDPWSIGIALGLGLILGTGYILTGSLLTCMFAHAVYNFALLLYEQHRMLSDPGYFGGKVPQSVALDLTAKPAQEIDEPKDV